MTPTEPTPAPRPVFVYGSLMRGMHNHSLLRTARFVRTARTLPLFVMYDRGGFPAVCHAPSDPPAAAVHGEVYAIDGPTLAALDRLEGHPWNYERQSVTLDDGRAAWMYVFVREDAIRDDARPVPDCNWRRYVNRTMPGPGRD